MKQVKVIRFKDLPTRLPLLSSCVAYLMLDHLNAAEWIWGATGFFFFFIWVCSIIAMSKETYTAIFEDE